MAVFEQLSYLGEGEEREKVRTVGKTDTRLLRVRLAFPLHLLLEDRWKVRKTNVSFDRQYGVSLEGLIKLLAYLSLRILYLQYFLFLIYLCFLNVYFQLS